MERSTPFDCEVDRIDGVADALTAPGVSPVAPLDGLVNAGGRAAGNRRAAHRAVFEQHVDFNGRVAPGIEDLARKNVEDGGR